MEKVLRKLGLDSVCFHDVSMNLFSHVTGSLSMRWPSSRAAANSFSSIPRKSGPVVALAPKAPPPTLTLCSTYGSKPWVSISAFPMVSHCAGFRRRRWFNLGLTCGLVQIIIAADNIKTAHDFTSSHNRHRRYLLIHSHEMLLQQRDIRRKFRVHCEGVGAWRRNP